MKIIEPNQDQPYLEPGDIIAHEDVGYMIIETDGKYIAKNMENGRTGLFGQYDSIRDLNAEFRRRNLYKDCNVYKAGKFALNIVEVK